MIINKAVIQKFGLIPTSRKPLAKHPRVVYNKVAR